MKPERVAWASALVACAALIAAPWRGHVDDFDAQIYTVVARNMARDGSWFDLRLLPSLRPVFREHLPFGLWPAAAAIRVAPEWVVNPLYGLMTLGAIAASGIIARRLAGAWAGVAAVLLLGTCESIWQYGGRLLLDPPLFLFATAAACAALASRWRWAALFGGLATLLKGPFGLLPLVCVAAVRLREWRAAAAVGAAIVPVAIFLAVDPGGGWRTGYLEAQLLASVTGGRADGIAAWWFPLAVVARRFWPGFPFLLLALWAARRNAALRPLLFACALLLAALCLPQRKWGNHTYVAFPLLAALAGAAAGPLVERVSIAVRVAGSVALGVIGSALSISGVGALVLQPPCAFSTTLRPALDRIAARSVVLMVGAELQDMTTLAAERDLVPEPVPEIPLEAAVHDAIARGPVVLPSGWTIAARTGSLAVLRNP
jgi:4-amino-4-deoxy-L-arabinose transferase-like glycosyltransferase